MKKGRREVAFLFVSHYGGQVQKKAALLGRLFLSSVEPILSSQP
jgi:hypothetical protein